MRFTTAAEADFSGLPQPVQVRSVQLLETVLAEFPFSGAAAVYEGKHLRMFPDRPYPYIILYAVEQDVLWVYRFLHGMMNWK